MRDLTKAEIEDYFDFARGDLHPENITQEQARLIGEVVSDREAMRWFILKSTKALLTGEIEPEDVLISLFVSGFQMGRECESRLVTLALKGQPR